MRLIRNQGLHIFEKESFHRSGIKDPDQAGPEIICIFACNVIKQTGGGGGGGGDAKWEGNKISWEKKLKIILKSKDKRQGQNNVKENYGQWCGHRY
jgi:hypothetical protein